MDPTSTLAKKKRKSSDSYNNNMNDMDDMDDQDDLYGRALLPTQSAAHLNDFSTPSVLSAPTIPDQLLPLFNQAPINQNALVKSPDAVVSSQYICGSGHEFHQIPQKPPVFDHENFNQAADAHNDEINTLTNDADPDDLNLLAALGASLGYKQQHEGYNYQEDIFDFAQGVPYDALPGAANQNSMEVNVTRGNMNEQFLSKGVRNTSNTNVGSGGHFMEGPGSSLNMLSAVFPPAALEPLLDTKYQNDLRNAYVSRAEEVFPSQCCGPHQHIQGDKIATVNKSSKQFPLDRISNPSPLLNNAIPLSNNAAEPIRLSAAVQGCKKTVRIRTAKLAEAARTKHINEQVKLYDEKEDKPWTPEHESEEVQIGYVERLKGAITNIIDNDDEWTTGVDKDGKSNTKHTIAHKYFLPRLDKKGLPVRDENGNVVIGYSEETIDCVAWELYTAMCTRQKGIRVIPPELRRYKDGDNYHAFAQFFDVMCKVLYYNKALCQDLFIRGKIEEIVDAPEQQYKRKIENREGNMEKEKTFKLGKDGRKEQKKVEKAAKVIKPESEAERAKLLGKARLTRGTGQKRARLEDDDELGGEESSRDHKRLKADSKSITASATAKPATPVPDMTPQVTKPRRGRPPKPKPSSDAPGEAVKTKAPYKRKPRVSRQGPVDLDGQQLDQNFLLPDDSMLYQNPPRQYNMGSQQYNMSSEQRDVISPQYGMGSQQYGMGPQPGMRLQQQGYDMAPRDYINNYGPQSSTQNDTRNHNSEFGSAPAGFDRQLDHNNRSQNPSASNYVPSDFPPQNSQDSWYN